MFGEEDLVKSHRARAEIIGNVLMVAFGLLLARLWYLQIFQGKIFYQYSLENRLRKEIVKAPRGMVFSRNNELLIHNMPSFDAVIIPQYLTNKPEVLMKLSLVLDMPVDTIRGILQKNSGQARYRPVVIKKNVSRKEVAIIETESAKMPGVFIQPFISRAYTDLDIGGHLYGYISEISTVMLPKLRRRDEVFYKLGDFIGHAGLEEQFDTELRGEDGHQYMEVDASGRVRRALASTIFKDIENRASNPGLNVRLTIDRDLQIAAYKALEGKVGSAVAVDVNTGEILSMVSRPSYDPSQFSTGISTSYWGELTSDENNPLRDRAIQEHYPPGSTFKTLVLLAALEEGLIDASTEVSCPGHFSLGKRKFHCWKKGGHGKVDMYRALRESCDVFFYRIATRLDIDTLAKYAFLFGLGHKTGISLPREISGLVPTKEWKAKRNGTEWQLGETLSCAIGQSYVLTTPLQMAMFYAAIANGGKLFRPYVIKEMFSNTGEIVKRGKPEIMSQIEVKPETFTIVRKGLFQVVNSPAGTAYWSRGQGIQMAGKTGTSQVARISAEKIYAKCEEREYKLRHHALFAAFAPHDDPKIAVAVIVEHGCHGSTAAAPVARDIITTYIEKYYPDLRHQIMIAEKIISPKANRAAIPVAPAAGMDTSNRIKNLSDDEE
ncbi:MAG: penicillin-binding protein 2 [Bdellovibrionales bacterium GWA2_49_15]|nr:MAG: penicillin-binding protein 2 [Bdellovibrionales bacterium GWA2_49_15]HAZ11878.1 penicillin-binding protein 2 [Bdellovibrionales bacterium]